MRPKKWNTVILFRNLSRIHYSPLSCSAFRVTNMEVDWQRIDANFQGCPLWVSTICISWANVAGSWSNQLLRRTLNFHACCYALQKGFSAILSTLAIVSALESNDCALQAWFLACFLGGGVCCAAWAHCCAAFCCKPRALDDGKDNPPQRALDDGKDNQPQEPAEHPEPKPSAGICCCAAFCCVPFCCKSRALDDEKDYPPQEPAHPEPYPSAGMCS